MVVLLVPVHPRASLEQLLPLVVPRELFEGAGEVPLREVSEGVGAAHGPQHPGGAAGADGRHRRELLGHYVGAVLGDVHGLQVAGHHRMGQHGQLHQVVAADGEHPALAHETE